MILSAGALQSPQLLMLSGIGPADHRRRVGVPVRHDLPGVGQHPHDHLDVIQLWNVAGAHDLFGVSAAGRWRTLSGFSQWRR